jgi:membrane fusion protein (multidrug efflux system)
VPVEAAGATLDRMDDYVLATTVVEAESEVLIRARVAGIVKRLHAEEGDTVRRNHLLVSLDKRELELAVQGLQARADNLKRILDRAGEMLEKQMIAQEEFELRKSEYDAARADLELSKLRLDYADIRSPIAGVVTHRQVEVGDDITTNQDLFVVADFDPLLARVHIPEKDLGKVRVGQSAYLEAESLPGQPFIGRVARTSPIVNPDSGTLKVTVEVHDARDLKPGSFVTVNIVTRVKPDALVIPKKALILESDMDRVYHIVGDTARVVRVERGLSDAERVEILSGLSPGDLVITRGQHGLPDGARVRIVTRADGGPLPAASDTVHAEKPRRSAERGQGGQHRGGDR